MSIEIDRQIAALKLAVECFLAPERAPQRSTDPRHQLLRPEWFGHIIVGSLIQCHHLVLLGTASRQNQNWSLRPLTKLSAYLGAVHVRQPEVQDDEIGTFTLGRLERVASTACDRHTIAPRA